ncbi:hypothetical protein ACYX8G_13785 [Microbacterium saperdae]
MFSQDDSPSVSRRAVITSAAWAVPVVAVAAATPLAAASRGADRFALALQSASITLPPNNIFPGFAYLTVTNTSPSALTAVTLSVSGIAPGAFSVGVGGGGPWQIISGDASTLVVGWTGSIAEGQSTPTLTLTVNYLGITPPPVIGVLTITPVGVSGVSSATLTATTT